MNNAKGYMDETIDISWVNAYKIQHILHFANIVINVIIISSG